MEIQDQIREDSWPVAIVRLDNTISEAFMKAFLHQWTEWLNRDEPFGMLCFYEGTDSKQSGEVKKMRKQWLKENRALIRKNMAGMAMVVKASSLVKMMRPIANTMAPKVFGCPARIFTWAEQEEANEWLQNQIAAFR